MNLTLLPLHGRSIGTTLTVPLRRKKIFLLKIPDLCIGAQSFLKLDFVLNRTFRLKICFFLIFLIIRIIIRN